MDHWIRVLDPADPSTASLFATGLAGPVALVTAPDGSLCYLNRKEWVKDEKFQPQTGSVHRIRYAANADGVSPRIAVQPDDDPTAVYCSEACADKCKPDCWPPESASVSTW